MRRLPDPDLNDAIQPPVLAGRWRLVRTLETHRSGAVFLAWDDLQRLWCAVDIAREESGVRRLQRERAVLRELDHPSIDTMTQVGVEGPVVYAARRYLRDTASRFAPMAPGHAIRLALAATDALRHAHERGRVHGALGPERLRFDVEGRVVVTGWADREDPHPRDKRVAELAPEVRAGSPPDARSDVHAIGALLFTLVTGRPEADLHLGLDGLTQGLRQVVASACAADPAARPKSATELHAWLIRRMETEEAPRRTPWGSKLMQPGPPPSVSPDAPLAGLVRALSLPTRRGPLPGGRVMRDLGAPSGDSASGTLDPAPRPLPSERPRPFGTAERDRSTSTGGSARLRSEPMERPIARTGLGRRRGLAGLLVAAFGGLVAALGSMTLTGWWPIGSSAGDDAADRALVQAVLAERQSIAPLSAAAADPDALERAWFALDDLGTPEAAAEVVRQVSAVDQEPLDPAARQAIGRLRQAEERWLEASAVE